MSLIVSVSGIRGIVGSELTPQVVFRYAIAFGRWLGGKSVALGRDSRPSGIEFRQAAIAGLTKAGCSVRDLGIVPTPTLGFLVRTLKCEGGLQITASHNPAAYNGLKLFGPDGAVLSAESGAEIQFEYEKSTTEFVGQFTYNSIDCSAESQRHIDRVLNAIDADAIRKQKFSIVLDANGGAGGPLATQFLTELNCQITAIGGEPDGNFLHEPEPTPDNLKDTEQIVQRTTGAIGCCLDPDADRLVMIDEAGKCLSEELTLALAIQSRLRQLPGPIVINLSTSQTTEDVAKAARVSCFRSAVGEANVVAKMREINALIGGEGNGGVIDPRIGWVRDPFIGMGLILESMAKTGKTLQELVGELPTYFIKKSKIQLPREKMEWAYTALIGHWPDAQIDRTDGLRISWPDRWLHLRGSNTEPVMRLIAEARSETIVEQDVSSALSLLRPFQPR